MPYACVIACPRLNAPYVDIPPSEDFCSGNQNHSHFQDCQTSTCQKNRLIIVKGCLLITKSENRHINTISISRKKERKNVGKVVNNGGMKGSENKDFLNFRGHALQSDNWINILLLKGKAQQVLWRTGTM